MAKFWFILIGENISGPFSTDDVKTKLSLVEATTNCMVWMKGQKQWMTALNWINNHDAILKQFAKSDSDALIWYAEFESNRIGPITEKKILEYLKSVEAYQWEHVKIWTTTDGSHKSLFQFPGLLEALGASRRDHLRAPLHGDITIVRDKDEFLGQALSISVTGIGVTNIVELSRGEHVKLTIKSDDLGTPIHALAIVRYAENQEVGLQFQNLHTEYQYRIIDYLRKFDDGKLDEVKRVA